MLRFFREAEDVLSDDVALDFRCSGGDNVATPGASGHDLVEGFPMEDISYMAEAALVLCSSDPKKITGRVAYSQPLLAEMQRRPPLR